MRSNFNLPPTREQSLCVRHPLHPTIATDTNFFFRVQTTVDRKSVKEQGGDHRTLGRQQIGLDLSLPASYHGFLRPERPCWKTVVDTVGP